MKIEMKIVASGKSEKAKQALMSVVNDVRSGSFQRDSSDDEIKVKATVIVLED